MTGEDWGTVALFSAGTREYVWKAFALREGDGLLDGRAASLAYFLSCASDILLRKRPALAVADAAACRTLRRSSEPPLTGALRAVFLWERLVMASRTGFSGSPAGFSLALHPRANGPVWRQHDQTHATGSPYFEPFSWENEAEINIDDIAEPQLECGGHNLPEDLYARQPLT